LLTLLVRIATWLMLHAYSQHFGKKRPVSRKTDTALFETRKILAYRG